MRTDDDDLGWFGRTLINVVGGGMSAAARRGHRRPQCTPLPAASARLITDAEINRFAAALARDLIGPDDFGSRALN